MKDWKSTLISRDASLQQAIETLDVGSLQIALVVDVDRRLLGTVTDGDIRRGILRGMSLNQSIQGIMNVHPTVARVDENLSEVLVNMRRKQLHRIPVVDERGCVIGVRLLEELTQPHGRENWVVLMAGGLGSRLRPLTDGCPKPMLKIGDRPLLETIIERFIEQGFRRFFVSVNYMADRIKEHFGDGDKWGAQIHYLEEDRKLGTAGALSLLPDKPSAPILVMNGDVLTKINFAQLLDFHREHHAQATMCVREYDFQVPYGVVKIDNCRITGIDEKPIQRFFVNAGIYVLEPEAMQYVPQEMFFDMPSLFETLIGAGKETVVFPIREYWLDIGQMADYARANGDFARVFS
ncbi:MAG: nucleotidyltransferase family protein [Rhodocyclaceae bacterium]|nr:nucleotidyltransferase family protein [Rhodocyclaceae bacterium]